MPEHTHPRIELPEQPNDLPSGFVLLGTEKTLPKGMEGWIGNNLFRHQKSRWMRGRRIGMTENTQYAFPIDSEAVKLWYQHMIPWDTLLADITCVAMDSDGCWFAYRNEVPELNNYEFTAQDTSSIVAGSIPLPRFPGEWRDSIIMNPNQEKQAMKDYTIHNDGSVAYRGEYLTPYQAETLVDSIEKIECAAERFRIKGETIQPHFSEFRIGCQTIPYSLVRQFCDEYRAGNWKQAKTYRAGQKLRFKSSGSIYILARLNTDQYTLINQESGNVWEWNSGLLWDGSPDKIPGDKIPGFYPENWEVIE